MGEGPHNGENGGVTVGWDGDKMDRSFLFRLVLQPLTGLFLDALDKIVGGDLDDRVAGGDMRRTLR